MAGRRKVRAIFQGLTPAVEFLQWKGRGESYFGAYYTNAVSLEIGFRERDRRENIKALFFRWNRGSFTKSLAFLACTRFGNVSEAA